MKKILWPVLLLAMIGGLIGYNMWNKPHHDVSKGQADIVVSCEELMSSYEKNEEEANKKYLQKTVEVKGKVAKVEKTEEGTTIVLGSPESLTGVRCEMLDKNRGTNVMEGEEVVIRGKCAGSLMDVVMQRCVRMK